MAKKFHVVKRMGYWDGQKWELADICDSLTEAQEKRSSIMAENTGDMRSDTYKVKIAYREPTEPEWEAYQELCK